jgi:hypothetical protein
VKISLATAGLLLATITGINAFAASFVCLTLNERYSIYFDEAKKVVNWNKPFHSSPYRTSVITSGSTVSFAGNRPFGYRVDMDESRKFSRQLDNPDDPESSGIEEYFLARLTLMGGGQLDMTCSINN